MTCKESNNSSYRENRSCYEDEISLVDLLRVIWKWKWVIIGGTLICAIAAAVISFQMPKIYEIATSVEPGIIGVDINGKFIYLDNSGNIGSKINEGIYDRQIIERLNLVSLKRPLKFKATVLKKNNFIKIRSQWKEENVDLGLKASEELFKVLADEYQEFVDHKKSNYANWIAIKQNEIARIKTRKKLKQATRKNIIEKKKELIKILNMITKNIEKIFHERDLIQKNKSTADKMTLLLYSTIAHQNMLYFNQLNNQLSDLNYKEEEKKENIAGFARDISDIKTQLNDLKQEQGFISNLKIVQAPEVSPYPVKPKKMLIVLLSGILSFFVFLFLAFFLEYIKNVSKKG